MNGSKKRVLSSSYSEGHKSNRLITSIAIGATIYHFFVNYFCENSMIIYDFFPNYFIMIFQTFS